jgi:hypothetical protein
MKISRYEQETVINFNAGESKATLYTRDPAVMRKLDALVNDYPDTFMCMGETDIDKTYELPKSTITYRKPRNISVAQRNAARERMRQFNGIRKE